VFIKLCLTLSTLRSRASRAGITKLNLVTRNNEKKREILHFIEFLKQRQTTTVQRNWQTVFQITQQFFEDFMADGRKQSSMMQ